MGRQETVRRRFYIRAGVGCRQGIRRLRIREGEYGRERRDDLSHPPLLHDPPSPLYTSPSSSVSPSFSLCPSQPSVAIGTRIRNKNRNKIRTLVEKCPII